MRSAPYPEAAVVAKGEAAVGEGLVRIRMRAGDPVLVGDGVAYPASTLALIFGDGKEEDEEGIMRRARKRARCCS